jgi:homoserine dehydrogenase
MTVPFRIAIAGLGTVGAGVVSALQKNADLVAMRAGRPVEIVAVSARDKKRKRGVDLKSYAWVSKPDDFLAIHNLDAVIELMGGADGPARSLVTKALGAGLDVVTANKAMIANHGYQLAALAEKNKSSLRFEAAVAGCVPVIKALREGLAANRMSAVYGILNGTCNYILTQMRETGRDFKSVLKDAQVKGYAEADPTFDVEGTDAAHKLAILSSLAFGARPDFKHVSVKGIGRVSAVDIDFAQQLGYKIKLLGIARDYKGKIMQSVEPCLVPALSPLGMVEDVYNAVYIAGDLVETPFFSGRGAGAGPTASAVIADIIDLARGHDVPAFGVPAKQLKNASPVDRGAIESRYYVRLNVLDKPGVLADVSAILRDHRISIESLLQRGRDSGQPVAVIIITHDTRHRDMVAACKLIGKLKAAVEAPCLFRIEKDL